MTNYNFSPKTPPPENSDSPEAKKAREEKRKKRKAIVDRFLNRKKTT